MSQTPHVCRESVRLFEDVGDHGRHRLRTGSVREVVHRGLTILEREDATRTTRAHGEILDLRALEEWRVQRASSASSPSTIGR
jgi:hypothetical protein